MPILREWAIDHESLREITRNHVLAVLPGSGTPRVTVGQALGSLFRTLKAHKITFINPTARITIGTTPMQQPLPAELDQLREAVHATDPVRKRLAAYLEHRRQQWPNTAHPHLFLNHRTAGHLRPVYADWITHTLGMSAQAILEDRILHEALATGGDTRRICDLFGLSVSGAERYAAVLDHPAITQPPKDPDG
jgi:hypothetical protein